LPSIAEALAGQLQNPHGAWGPVVGGLMRLVNREPNDLALAALGVRRDDDVLELGFGPGEGLRALARLSPKGVIFGVDQSAAMLAQATARNRRNVESGRVRLSLARFDDTSLPGQSVDRILAVNVAYFWSDAPRVLAELDRVLRPGGRISVYVTDAAAMVRWAFAASGHHRLFDAAGLRAMLAEGPFPKAAIKITPRTLRLGVAGLLAVIDKPRDHAPDSARRI
jgi:ubiquinone/menaquinone biosynthesis C-methylase UbiE